MRTLVFATLVSSLIACSADTKGVEKKVDDLAKDVRELKAMIAKGGGGAGANAQAQAQQRQEPAPDAQFAVDISPNMKIGMTHGPEAAPVTIVEAWDLACPYCQRVSSTIDKLVNDYNGKVRVVFKNLVVHPQMVARAHLAVCAAGKQGKFYDFYKTWWEKSYKPYQDARDASKLSEENMMSWVSSIGLDPAKMKADMDSQECQQLVANDAAELRKFRVGSTPSFFINGHYVAGAMDESAFKTMIDEQLKIAEASGAGNDYYDKVIMTKGEKAFRAAGTPKPN